MRKARLILSASLLTIGTFSAMTFSSCSKDDVVCPTGMEGKNCDVQMRTKFIKTWSANETSGTDQLVYSCTIAAGAAINQVVISSTFSENFFDNNINATVNGNTITISNQKPDGGASLYSVEGQGTYAGGEISWNYIIIQDGTGNKITTNGVWK